MGTHTAGAGPPSMTVDQLAAAAGTTTRHVRSLQTLGLLARPELRGRTGLYGPDHQDRLVAVLRLQAHGFSLESLRILFDAQAAGRSLASVLGLPESPPLRDRAADGAQTTRDDAAALYGFADLQPARRGGADRPSLSVVPTTVWEDSRAS